MAVNYRHNPNGFAGNDPGRIIIHAMGEYLDYEGERLYAPDFLDSIGLSAHRLITPTGDTIVTRRDLEGAYHAKGHNQDTLGFELLVPEAYNMELFEEILADQYLSGVQFRELVRNTREAMEEHDIDRDCVQRHSDVDPERKIDPGEAFPWSLFQAELGRVA